MRCGSLLSGGKDSIAATWRAFLMGAEITCFITVSSKNSESYMYHTPNVAYTTLQAEAAGIPHIIQESEGLEEEELNDLESAIRIAKSRYQIEAVITGAIRSVYQATRIEKICYWLGLWCLSPLWLSDEEEYMREIIGAGFEIIIAGVFADPFDASWLGRLIDYTTLNELIRLKKKYGVSLTGEGGEYETFVCDAPIFKDRICLKEVNPEFHAHSGTLKIIQAELVSR